MENVYVGIDISKAWLDIAVHASSQQWHFPNDTAGITRLRRMLKKISPTLIVCEPTGGYEMPLHLSLNKAGFSVAMVNPRQIRDFAKSTGKLAKTDSLDARVIAHFGYAIQPTPRPVIEDQKLKALISRRIQLLGMVTMETNRLRGIPKALKGRIEAHVAWLKQDLDDTDCELRKII